MAKKMEMDTEKLIAKAKEVHGDDAYDYTKTVFVNWKTSIKFYCPKHERECSLAPALHLKGHRCKTCGYESMRMTKEEFIKRSQEIYGIGKYDYSKVIIGNKRDKVEIYCNIHKFFFSQTRSTHLRGSTGCKECSTCRSNTEEFIEKSKRIHGDNTFIYDEVNYIDKAQKVILKCRAAGHRFLQCPNSNLMGHGCKQCFLDNRQPKISQEEFIERIEKINTLNYDYSQTIYNGAYNPITVICREHGPFIVRAAIRHLSGGGVCPICPGSKGEREIADLLVSNKIDFLAQYMFDDCLSPLGKKLRFDFYIPSYRVAIEFDGGQHSKPVELFGGEKEFEKIKLYDQIKNDYCAINNIDLIRIPYNKNLREILENKILF